MGNITVDFNKEFGQIKPMHCTNNGPVKGVGFGWQKSGTYEAWQAAGIPYARTHDSSLCSSYGGEHTVDVHAVFPNFDADVNDPESYDFTITDAYLNSIMSCGTEVYYRLGSKIEHQVKKYNTIPPKDFKKWAQICEHIIMHYNEGWADGFHHNIKYWEIWNEPDLDDENSTNKRTWGGSVKEFYEFYEIAATHLKARFPHLKIGGPACAFREPWFEGFLKHLTSGGKKVSLDFFSWHCYGSLPGKIFARSEFIRNKLDEYGYTETMSILNEWNYVKSWDEFIYSVKHIISIKGAAFTSACMCGCQNNTSVDMLMYYDARPSKYNGLFDFYTTALLKGYYPFKMFNSLYKLGTACKCKVSDENIYAAAAKGENGTAIMISYFTDDDTCTETIKLNLDFVGGVESYEAFLLDNNHDAESVGIVENGSCIDMEPNTVLLFESLQ